MNASPGGVNVRSVVLKSSRLVVRAREDQYSSSEKVAQMSLRVEDTA